MRQGKDKRRSEMLLKEEEARKKWCPFSQISASLGGKSEEITCCVASNCILWQPIAEGEGVCGLCRGI